MTVVSDALPASCSACTADGRQSFCLYALGIVGRILRRLQYVNVWFTYWEERRMKENDAAPGRHSRRTSVSRRKTIALRRSAGTDSAESLRHRETVDRPGANQPGGEASCGEHRIGRVSPMHRCGPFTGRGCGFESTPLRTGPTIGIPNERGLAALKHPTPAMRHAARSRRRHKPPPSRRTTSRPAPYTRRNRSRPCNRRPCSTARTRAPADARRNTRETPC